MVNYENRVTGKLSACTGMNIKPIELAFQLSDLLYSSYSI